MGVRDRLCQGGWCGSAQARGLQGSDPDHAVLAVVGDEPEGVVGLCCAGDVGVVVERHGHLSACSEEEGELCDVVACESGDRGDLVAG